MGEQLDKLLKKVIVLENKVNKLAADFGEFKRLALEIKPDGFDAENYLGFSVEQLMELAKQKGFHKNGKPWGCSFECGNCIKGQRLTCWETLNGEADYEEEAGTETTGEEDDGEEVARAGISRTKKVAR